MIRFWATIKGLCYREINLFCEEKMFKKNHRDGFLGKRVVWEVWEVLLNIFEIQ